MCVKMAVMSCAAKAAPRSLITNALASEWHPRANGIARIALPRGPPLHSNSKLKNREVLQEELVLSKDHKQRRQL